MIAQYVDRNHWRWDERIRELQFAYNSATHDATGYTPAYINLGRELLSPVNAKNAARASGFQCLGRVGNTRGAVAQGSRTSGCHSFKRAFLRAEETPTYGLSTEGSQWGLIMYPSGGGFVVWPPPPRPQHNQDDISTAKVVPPNIRNQYRAAAGSTFVAGCIFDHTTETHLVEIFDRLQSPSIVGLQLPGLLRACQQPAIRKKFMIRKLYIYF
ncbi:hypothetical protein ALC57_17394 [Trachymyrmex cornetzi]|uniref:Integrase catalytic domain-containing protein n=1 Tax=Trachymyrmex cornetzi TaxID=471704 RepID=A0A151ITU3_9HYME|nr:hypothetical protein ALC57_17394 [Trachymyrmex cornetzi]